MAKRASEKVRERLASMPKDVEEKLLAAGPMAGKMYRDWCEEEDRRVKAKEEAARDVGTEDMDTAFRTVWDSAPPSVRANLLALKHRMDQDRGQDLTFKKVLDRCEALNAQWKALGKPETPIPS